MKHIWKALCMVLLLVVAAVPGYAVSEKYADDAAFGVAEVGYAEPVTFDLETDLAEQKERLRASAFTIRKNQEVTVEPQNDVAVHITYLGMEEQAIPEVAILRADESGVEETDPAFYGDVKTGEMKACGLFDVRFETSDAYGGYLPAHDVEGVDTELIMLVEETEAIVAEETPKPVVIVNDNTVESVLEPTAEVEAILGKATVDSIVEAQPDAVFPTPGGKTANANDFKEDLYKLAKEIGQEKYIIFVQETRNLGALYDFLVREKKLKKGSDADFAKFKQINNIDKKYEEWFNQQYRNARENMANAQVHGYKAFLLLQENKIAEAEREYKSAAANKRAYDDWIQLVHDEMLAWKPLGSNMAGGDADFKEDLYRLAREIGQEQFVIFVQETKNIDALYDFLIREKKLERGSHADFDAFKKLNNIDKKYETWFNKQYRNARENMANAQVNAYKALQLLQENKIAEAEREYKSAVANKNAYDEWIQLVHEQMQDWKPLTESANSNFGGGAGWTESLCLTAEDMGFSVEVYDVNDNEAEIAFNPRNFGLSGEAVSAKKVDTVSTSNTGSGNVVEIGAVDAVAVNTAGDADTSEGTEGSKETEVTEETDGSKGIFGGFISLLRSLWPF